TGCGPRPAPRAVEEPVRAAGLHATIRWTSFGVPHVTADDLAGLGFGQGYATARQHVCVLADQFVRVAGERARWFGAGPDDANLDSDLFHRALHLDRRVAALRAGMSDDAREVLRGWVAGYDHYLARTPPAQRPEACRDAAWVRPIGEDDLLRLHVAMATIASSRLFTTEIARAAPHPTGTARPALPDAEPAARPASNGWALGADRTESDHGLLVANPHFPWEGELTFSELHLTLPGEIDVYGATLPGVPMVGIGFNRHQAWTHTFSASTRFVLYRLPLVDDAYHYRRDGKTVAMVAQTYAIDVLGADGAITEVTRTLYSTPQGPVIDAAEAPWQPGVAAYVLHDVALEAGSVIDLDLALARARGVDDVRAALAVHATPFLNTLAADVDGNAYYADASLVPDLSPEALAAWPLARKAVPELEAAWQRGVVVLDGSSSRFDLVTDDPAIPGAIPFDAAPELLRRDYAMNANDPWAFGNADAPVGDGFSILYGDPDRPPTPRTLMNLRMLREKSVIGASGPDGLFSRAEAGRAILSNRSFTGEQLRDEVRGRCDDEVARRRAAEAAAAAKAAKAA
ncbi:MAG: penicillin acylase family protein, partial [Myxococcales bacterium]|nr:penicillin acylase family protein [Myxococcales bacterium]